MMRCLIIDNYDSFTWNLADYVGQIFDEKPVIIHNDQYSWEDLKRNISFDCIIISPGPGSVVNDADFHVSRPALMQDEIPVLGICLGLQGLAYAYGGQITHASEVFHGRSSLIYHNESSLFHGIPSPFDGVRYHSLMVSTVPDELLVTAQTKSGIIMALQHKHLPKWGVQFHPESILTDWGKTIIKNFQNLASAYSNKNPVSRFRGIHSTYMRNSIGSDVQRCLQNNNKYHSIKKCSMITRKLVEKKDSENIFLSLFAKEENCFWLDSQGTSGEMSRFSFMGAVGKEDIYIYKLNAENGIDGNEFINSLEQEVESVHVEVNEQLPFEFRGGLVGFLTYEMKALFGARKEFLNKIPDALWMKVRQFIGIDHLTDTIWIAAISEQGQENIAETWVNEMYEKILSVKAQAKNGLKGSINQLNVNMNMGYESYLSAIKESQRLIKDGETYEVCLTNQFSFDAQLDPMVLYQTMRKENPAPFGAFIKSGKNFILSTSPERFIKVNSSGHIQVKPIKGTSSRSIDKHIDEFNANQLSQSEKERAENLMIVDLMRNDLSRVSKVGTVSVPKLMAIESYKTVHQMVSTIESDLKSDKTLIDLLRAIFPGGSVTGAPKLRTMEIIDKLEQTARGVYCGTIGYLGYNRIADLNIAIRTVSYDGEKVCFGAGGAVTYLSDPVNEFEEIVLKAEAVLKPIWSYLSNNKGEYKYRLDGKQLVIC